MKGLAESSPFHLLTNPHMINRFIFGHGVVIYYLLDNAMFRKLPREQKLIICFEGTGNTCLTMFLIRISGVGNFA